MNTPLSILLCWELRTYLKPNKHSTAEWIFYEYTLYSANYALTFGAVNDSDDMTIADGSGTGVGLTKLIFSVPLFSTFSVFVKTNASYGISRLYLAGVAAAQCGDTCQIWMWFRESNKYFCKIENFAYGEISERSFSNPHPTGARKTG